MLLSDEVVAAVLSVLCCAVNVVLNDDISLSSCYFLFSELTTTRVVKYAAPCGVCLRFVLFSNLPFFTTCLAHTTMEKRKYTNPRGSLVFYVSSLRLSGVSNKNDVDSTLDTRRIRSLSLTAFHFPYLYRSLFASFKARSRLISLWWSVPWIFLLSMTTTDPVIALSFSHSVFFYCLFSFTMQSLSCAAKHALMLYVLSTLTCLLSMENVDPSLKSVSFAFIYRIPGSSTALREGKKIEKKKCLSISGWLFWSFSWVWLGLFSWWLGDTSLCGALLRARILGAFFVAWFHVLDYIDFRSPPLFIVLLRRNYHSLSSFQLRRPLPSLFAYVWVRVFLGSFSLFALLICTYSAILDSPSLTLNKSLPVAVFLLKSLVFSSPSLLLHFTLPQCSRLSDSTAK